MTRALVKRIFANSSVTLEEELITIAPESLEDHAGLPWGPVESWRYRFVKRFLDILFSAIMTAAFAVPAFVIAAAIRFTSEGPVFYRERRIGRNGREFRIWKFRSMYCNAPHHAHGGGARADSHVLEWRIRKHGGDPRVTPIGRFLRRWSLDEIPQVLNVLRGEMSLVGPRPIIAAETVFYGEGFSYYLAATPGLSGLWQVSGRSDIGYATRVKLDMIYVGSWSLRSDLFILLRTIPAVLSRKGAR